MLIEERPKFTSERKKKIFIPSTLRVKKEFKMVKWQKEVQERRSAEFIPVSWRKVEYTGK